MTRAVNQDVLDVLAAGRGQILYRGHGNENAWPPGWDGSGTGSGSSFSAWAHVDKLTNRVQPIIYAINCLNSRINQNDCIAEHWMSLADAGAVAHYGATVTGSIAERDGLRQDAEITSVAGVDLGAVDGQRELVGRAASDIEELELGAGVEGDLAGAVALELDVVVGELPQGLSKGAQ